MMYTSSSATVEKLTSNQLNSENRGIRPRGDKNVSPAINNSIQMVASQLLQSTTLATSTPLSASIVDDMRIPPKVKNQYSKYKQTTEKYLYEVVENSHAGIAVPVSLEDIEIESNDFNVTKESSTPQEGISTWVLLNNPSSTVEPEKTTNKVKVEIETKKPLRLKPEKLTNKTKKPSKRPIIAGPNKSDLIAGGSAINENVLNKLKETVLNNVQKHSNQNKTTITSTAATTQKPITTTSITLITKKDFTTKAPKTTKPTVSMSEKPKTKKKIKNKHKNNVVELDKTESALLPMEPKEQEIELEVSTPPTTTKKSKRTSSKRKKNKQKKRKTSKKPDTPPSGTKVSNSTKLSKPPSKQKPITTQIYNYLSREVMPTVGVGIVGLAGLVGLASYFLYPFAGPVRRAYNIDKKDDIYHNNAEEYASAGNGQAEEEMLGTVLAGMPGKSKRNNPYAGQLPYRQKNNKIDLDQNLRFRHSSVKAQSNSPNTQFIQDKSEYSHDLAYSQPIAYNIYESDKNNLGNTYGAPEPMYPQITPSRPIAYNGEPPQSVYRMPGKQQNNFEPAYPFEGQVLSDTTNNPNNYQSTSLYLGSDNESQPSESLNYVSSDQEETVDNNQFVVGNVPKQIVQSVTPAVVPEHGPRKLKRRKRNIVQTLEEILRASRQENVDSDIANEIDEALGEKHENVKKSISSSSSSQESSDVGINSENISLDKSNFGYRYKTPKVRLNVLLQKEKSSDVPSPESDSKEQIGDVSKENESLSDKKTDESSGEFSVDLPSIQNISTKPLNENSDIEYVNNVTPEPSGSLSSEDEKDETGDTKTSKESVESDVTNSGIDINDLTTTVSPLLSSYVTLAPTMPSLNSSDIFKQDTQWTPYKLEKNKVFSFLKRLIEYKYNLALEVLHASSRSINSYMNGMEFQRYNAATPKNKIWPDVHLT